MSADAAVLECCGLTKEYRRGRRVVKALDDIHLRLLAGETVALTGESGSGKSTLARCLGFMERPDSGRIFVNGVDVADASRAMREEFRRNIQIVLQSTAAAMNPDFTAWEVVEEPLVIAGDRDRTSRRARAQEAMGQVGFPVELGEAPSREISGGQRQRLAIARALMVKPKVLILDEALAGLDWHSARQIVGLLRDLQRATGVACLLITHAVRLAGDFPSRTCQMRSGQMRSGEMQDSWMQAGSPA